ncbi:hypothetical protein PT286_07580 [Neisseriaceae bacterium ESL0693]|nr:hypothetical protein [Neisseriaceae bacterium ESL0693]
MYFSFIPLVVIQKLKKQEIIEADNNIPTPSTEEKNEAEKVQRDKENLIIPHNEPNTTYKIIWHKKNSSGLFEAIIERVGSSGTSYSKHEIDCDSQSIRYLGDGDTLEKALMYRPDPKLIVPVEGSSADAIVNTVCSNFNEVNNILDKENDVINDRLVNNRVTPNDKKEFIKYKLQQISGSDNFSLKNVFIVLGKPGTIFICGEIANKNSIQGYSKFFTNLSKNDGIENAYLINDGSDSFAIQYYALCQNNLNQGNYLSIPM